MCELPSPGTPLEKIGWVVVIIEPGVCRGHGGRSVTVLVILESLTRWLELGGKQSPAPCRRKHRDHEC